MKFAKNVTQMIEMTIQFMKPLFGFNTSYTPIEPIPLLLHH